MPRSLQNPDPAPFITLEVLVFVVPMPPKELQEAAGLNNKLPLNSPYIHAAVSPAN